MVDTETFIAELRSTANNITVHADDMDSITEKPFRNPMSQSSMTRALVQASNTLLSVAKQIQAVYEQL